MNVGHRPLEIRSAGLSFNDGYEFVPLHYYDSELPKKISDGDSARVLFPYLDAVQALKQQRSQADGVTFSFAFVRDAEGKTYETEVPRVLPKCDLASLVLGCLPLVTIKVRVRPQRTL